MGSPYFGTPQSHPIPGRESVMAPNAAGGYGFTLSNWDRLDRFLIIGSVGGTYYVGQKKLTDENTTIVLECLKEDGVRTVKAAHQINTENRAPGTDEQLYVMALAAQHGNTETKAAVRELLPDMLRTGTHVLHFGNMLFGQKPKSSRFRRRLIADWFANQDADKVAFQVLKYQSRDGVSQRDLLRYGHPQAPTLEHAAVYDWICGRDITAFTPEILAEHNRIQGRLALGMSPVEVTLTALMLSTPRVPREALPSAALTDRQVLLALLPNTPLHALLRNLGSWTANGLFDPLLPFSIGALQTTCDWLTDPERLRRARVHPFAIMLAMMVYAGGHGIRGSKTWLPDRDIMDALERAFKIAFGAIEPIGQRILFAADVSGSMTTCCRGTPVQAQEAAAALMVSLAAVEPHARTVTFDTKVVRELYVTRETKLRELVRAGGGGTDLAAPVDWAIRSRLPFDAIVIATDNETWAGKWHNTQLLAHYRATMGLKTKLVVAAMASSDASIVDPADPLQLGISGLDGTLPQVIRQFLQPEQRLLTYQDAG